MVFSRGLLLLEISRKAKNAMGCSDVFLIKVYY